MKFMTSVGRLREGNERGKDQNICDKNFPYLKAIYSRDMVVLLIEEEFRPNSLDLRNISLDMGDIHFYLYRFCETTDGMNRMQAYWCQVT